MTAVNVSNFEPEAQEYLDVQFAEFAGGKWVNLEDLLFKLRMLESDELCRGQWEIQQGIKKVRRVIEEDVEKNDV